ncbi:hypothetical protein V491_03527 [Pseudogymnoascus sp. VKM F-3775]|nr:hypothetical protein V491_03527 [Pseudogymnoascus sp. VKM F-3775]
MAEIVGTVSGTIGMAAVALQATRTLLDDLKLFNVQLVIDRLQVALKAGDWEPETHNVIQAGNVEAAPTACKDSCIRFHSGLQNLLKHSTDGKISKRDKFAFGFMSKGRVAAFKSELSLCKSTVGLALNAANYMVAVEQYKQLQGLVKQEQNNIQRRSVDAEAPEQNTVDVSLESDIERGVQLLDGYRELLTLVQSKADECRTKLEIGEVSQDNSKIIAGITNADGTEGELDIKIGNVMAAGGSRGIIGYSKGIDLAGFFA